MPDDYFDPTIGSGAEEPFELARPKQSDVPNPFVRPAAEGVDDFLEEEFVFGDARLHEPPEPEEFPHVLEPEVDDFLADNVEITDVFVPPAEEPQVDIGGLLYAQLNVLVAIATHLGVQL